MIPELNERPAIDPVYERFVQELQRRGFAGDIGIDYAHRLAQATDNSIYQVLPQAVLAPRHKEDLGMISQLMNEPGFEEVTISPRGGGTGTNGQSLTKGLLVDVSAHMNRILEVQADEGWARVEPGVVLDQLNEVLQPTGTFFAPDLSPSNRATLGGMVNTDACGKGSRLYGKTSQHILELDLVLVSGDHWQSVPLTADELAALKQRTDRIGQIHQAVDDVISANQALIQEKFPNITRYLTGYNLKHVWDASGRFNMNYLISGSEGTLAFVAGIKVKLTPIPAYKKLVLVKYESFQDSLRAARTLVATDPAAIETIDDTILRLAREDVIWEQVQRYFQAAGDERVKGINLVEFVDDDPASLDAQVRRLTDRLTELQGQPGEAIGFEQTDDPAGIKALWSLRKKGVGLLGNRPGQRRPIPFVEDTVVPPENLADYIVEFRALLDEFGLSYGMFGHVDVGCLHVRPALDLRQEQDEQLVRVISDRVRDLVLKYNGVIWGEHGKGFRGEYMPDFFGQELYKALRQIKSAFDPDNRLNPGKLVSPLERDDPIDRLDQVPLRAHFDRQIPAAVRENYAVSINCNGNGACFNYTPRDVMCPSYKWTRDRIHSPKGRAGMMREWLRQMSHKNYDLLAPAGSGGKQSKGVAYDFSHEVYEAMDGCLSCKACTSQCPIKVDIPDLKAKFLYHYHSRYRRPLADHLVAKSERLHGRFMKLPQLYNFWVKRSWVQRLMRRWIGMRDAPLLSSPHVYARAHKEGFPAFDPEQIRSLPDSERAKTVLILPDAVTALYEAPVVIDVIRAMRYLGYQPVLLPYLENGKPMHVKGFLDEFAQVARQTNRQLRDWATLGVPMVGIDPAITLTYREEYRQLLGEERGDYEVLMVQEWLARESREAKHQWPRLQRAPDKPVQLLGHCGEKTAAPAYGRQWQQVFQAVGADLELADVGCCGMAGAFGHEDRHYEDSKGVYNLSWAAPVEQAKRERRVVMATGASCRSQVERFSEESLPHPLQSLAALFDADHV
jgi:FAD/FMN-containing dehydrogenase/Fe-S oxidoreductase